MATITNPLLGPVPQDATHHKANAPPLDDARKLSTSSSSPSGLATSTVEGVKLSPLVSRILYLCAAFAFVCVVVPGPIELRELQEAVMGQVASSDTPFCSSHGDMFQDALYGNGEPVCECHPCYFGERCAEFNKTCALDLSSGSPHVFDAYWKANEASGTVVIPPSYRLGYENNGAESLFHLRALENAIRSLHDFVGNAETEGRHLVIGAGATQVLSALYFGLTEEPMTGGTSGFEKAVLTSADPHYQLYDAVPNFYKSERFRYPGNQSSAGVVNSNRLQVEIITSPNNPDGLNRKPLLKGKKAVSIYDFAYYWPQYTPIYEKMDVDIAVFTLSKISGHAGSRVGWALVKDPALAVRAQIAVMFMTIGVSHEAQLRATQLLSSIVSGYKKQYGKTDKPATSGFSDKSVNSVSLRAPVGGVQDAQGFAEQQLCLSYAAAMMTGRWQMLREAFAAAPKNARLSLQRLEPAQMCGFFKTVRDPAPAYLWLRCEWAEDTDCYTMFVKETNLLGRSGLMYGVGADYVRFSLLCHQTSFLIMMDRIRSLLGVGSGEAK
eukprot:TRINITY_DN23794_c0_g1_i1.p1 TRINITY_DN23794_c0_g1~~TRINITY_DN23794_c0_g1_i1.p1  ORF type:complete len:552 (-),score=80.79 TRINITY_DN23794_c0_g1_i1:1045-2700(-)